MASDFASFEFRLLTRADFALLARWLATPHVNRWWADDHSLSGLEEHYGPAIDGVEPSWHYVVSLDGSPTGFVQVYRIHDYPEYAEELAPLLPVPDDAGSIDYFVGEPSALGRGVGRRMIAAFLDRIRAAHPEVGSLIVAVNAANERSWRMLLGAGFEIACRGELEPDNPIDGRTHVVCVLHRRTEPCG